jgi:hypothetical protein
VTRARSDGRVPHDAPQMSFFVTVFFVAFG